MADRKIPLSLNGQGLSVLCLAHRSIHLHRTHETHPQDTWLRACGAGPLQTPLGCEGLQSAPPLGCFSANSDSNLCPDASHDSRLHPHAHFQEHHLLRPGTPLLDPVTSLVRQKSEPLVRLLWDLEIIPYQRQRDDDGRQLVLLLRH